MMLRVLTVFLGMLLLVGPVGMGAPAKLIIGHWGFGTEQQKLIMAQAISTFQKTHPDVEVELVTPGTNNARFIEGVKVRLAGGSQLDIVGVDIPKFQSFMQAGFLLDLNPYMQADRSFEMNRFYHWVWNGYRLSGGIYGVPDRINHRQMFLRGQLLNEAGVAMPTNDWTWEDFLRIARRTTRDTSGDGVPDIYGMEGYRMWWDFWPVFAWGGGMYRVSGGSVQSAILAPETIEAMETFLSLEKEYRVMTTAALENTRNRVNMILNGEIAMYIGDVLQLQAGREYDVSLNPTLRLFPKVKSQPVVGFTNGWAVTRASKQSALAWEFLRNLTSREVMTEAQLKQGLITTRQDVNSPATLYPGLDRSFVQQIMLGLSRMDIDLHAHQAQGPWANVDLVTNAMNKIREHKDPVRSVLESVAPVFDANLSQYLKEMAEKY